MINLWLLGLLTAGLIWGPPAFTFTLRDDVHGYPECRYCGMKRDVFAHSRMMVRHGNGEWVGVCSLNCASIDYLRNVDDSPGSFKVGDYASRKLIDAEKAYWVLGGSEPGVMTSRAKWAFEHKHDAVEFIRLHGGELIDFEAAVKASYVDIYEEMRLLKRQKMEYSRAARADKNEPES